MNKIIISILLTVLLSTILYSNPHPQVRLKDITDVRGSYTHDIVGYGIVVGLEGTGDGSKSMFTIQSIANMLEYYGISVDKKKLKPKNVAAVMVTAHYPTHGKIGSQLDVTLSSIGDAKSLQGGNLLLTPLTNPLAPGESEVYANASGPISIGGFNIASGEGDSFRKNYTLVGRIPSGATITKESNEQVLQKDGSVSLYLKSPDFTTSVRVTKSINNFFGENIASTVDKAEIKIDLPKKYKNDNSKAMEFVALMEGIKVQTDNIAKVVVNERTGTIIIGENVKLNQVAISHGNISIKIDKDSKIVQPNAFAGGNTANQQNGDLKVEEDLAKVIQNKETATLKQLVDALNKLGVTPRDMISIFQALKEAGALHAELVLI